MPYKNKEKNREYQRKWVAEKRLKQPLIVRVKRRAYRKRIRMEAIEILGGKCVNCGCDNYDVLEFNHINGDGCNEVRKYTGSVTEKVARDIVAGRRDDIEILCKICNAWHYVTSVKGVVDCWTIEWTPRHKL